MWGYLIAAVIVVPITAWARHGGTGMWVLVATFGLSLLLAFGIRLWTGRWPA